MRKYILRTTIMGVLEVIIASCCQNFLLCAKRKNALSPWNLANERRDDEGYYWLLLDAKVPKVFRIL